MSAVDFQHIRLSTIDHIVLIELICPDLQGPQLVKDVIAELTLAVNQDSATPILVDLGRTGYFSSMGYSALFKIVKLAKERQRPIRFCDMHPDVRVGAEIVGLKLVVETHDCRKSALEAFRQGGDGPRSLNAKDSDSTPAMYTI
jgi:anti-anti-sigma regulatory factor